MFENTLNIKYYIWVTKYMGVGYLLKSFCFKCIKGYNNQQKVKKYKGIQGTRALRH